MIVLLLRILESTNSKTNDNANSRGGLCPMLRWGHKPGHIELSRWILGGGGVGGAAHFYIYIYMYVYVCMHTYAYPCGWGCVYVYIYIYVYLYIPLSIGLCIDAFI